MSKLKALEKVFAAEVEARLPYQSRAKIFQRLCDEGLIAPMERKWGGQFPVTVSGWQLTHAGRLLYCSSCSEEESQPAAAE